MAAFTIHQAKTNLSKLIARAEAGEEVIIKRGKTAVARLSPMGAAKRKLTFGMLKGKIPDLPDSFFFDPLPEEELRLWEGDDEGAVRQSRLGLVSARRQRTSQPRSRRAGKSRN